MDAGGKFLRPHAVIIACTAARATSRPLSGDQGSIRDASAKSMRVGNDWIGVLP